MIEEAQREVILQLVIDEIPEILGHVTVQFGMVVSAI